MNKYIIMVIIMAGKPAGATTTESPYKVVYICGYDHNDALGRQFSSFSKLADAHPDDFCVVGDSKVGTSRDEIRDKLVGRLSDNTKIFVGMHGNIRNGMHKVTLSKTIEEDTLDFLIHLDVMERDAGMHKSAKQVYMTSCYSGEAAEYSCVLDVGMVCAFSTPDTVTRDPIPNDFYSFLERNSDCNFADIMLNYFGSLASKGLFVGCSDGHDNPTKNYFLDIDSIKTESPGKVISKDLSELFSIVPDALLPHKPTRKQIEEKLLEEIYENGKQTNLLTKNLHAIVSSSLVHYIDREYEYVSTGRTDIKHNFANVSPHAVQEIDKVDPILWRSIILLEWESKFPKYDERFKDATISIMKTAIRNGARHDILDPQGDTVLTYSSFIGESKIVKSLIDSGVDPDQVGKDRKTALHYAVSYDNTDLTEYLMRKGANPNIQDQDGKTPISIAISEKNFKLFDLLLQYGANPEIPDSTGVTPIEALSKEFKEQIRQPGLEIIHIAISKNWKGVSEYLLRDPRILGHKDDCERTLLHHAVKHNNIEIFDSLVAKGIDINAQDEFGMTALSFAVARKNEVMVQKLLEHPSISLDARDYSENTAIGKALSAKNYEIADLRYSRYSEEGKREFFTKILIQGDAIKYISHIFEKFPEDKEKYSPVMLETLINEGAMYKLKELYSIGVDINCRTVSKGETGLHFAVKNRDRRFVKDLLAMHASINIQDEDGNTPLMLPFANKTISSHDIINLREEVDLTLRNKDGKNALEVLEASDSPMAYIIASKSRDNGRFLQEALERRNKVMIKAILEISQELHFRDADDAIEVFARLLNMDYGYDTLLKKCPELTRLQNKDGKTILHVASNSGNIDILKRMIPLSDLNIQDKDGKTALHYIMQKDTIDPRILLNLVQAGSDLNIQDKDGKTALHYIVQQDTIDPRILLNLVKAGADIYMRDAEGKSSLDYAIEKGKNVRLLLHNAPISEVDLKHSLVTSFQNQNLDNFILIAQCLKAHNKNFDEIAAANIDLLIGKKTTEESDIFNIAVEYGLRGTIAQIQEKHHELISKTDPATGYTRLHKIAQSGMGISAMDELLNVAPELAYMKSLDGKSAFQIYCEERVRHSGVLRRDEIDSFAEYVRKGGELSEFSSMPPRQFKLLEEAIELSNKAHSSSFERK